VALVLLILWPLAAFGGRSARVALSFSLCCILFALVRHAGPSRRGGARRLDRVLMAIGVFCVSQAVPLPARVVNVLSPHTQIVRQALTLTPSTSVWTTLSIDAASTMWAAVIASGAFALFFAARGVLADGGLRQTVRGISAIGLGFSALAIAQAATAGRSIYWRFPTEYEGPLPFGPFVNRNHFATWVIMAAPLCVGYIMARAGGPQATSPQFVSARARVTRIADGRMAWLVVAAVVMVAALLMSMSRSGILSLSAAAIITPQALPGRPLRRGKRWAIGILLIAAGIAVARVDIPGLASRFAQSGSDVENRVRIWRDTLSLVGDFWLTGSGAGSYRTAMLFYQRADRVVQFNQAHNHYLQVLAEGGVVLLGLVLGGIRCLTGAVREQLSADRSGTYWIRAGAACGLTAVALQGLWETGLVMPANAALAAVVAAIASYERQQAV
jgi:O-antigen ligase